ARSSVTLSSVASSELGSRVSSKSPTRWMRVTSLEDLGESQEVGHSLQQGAQLDLATLSQPRRAGGAGLVLCVFFSSAPVLLTMRASARAQMTCQCTLRVIELASM